MNIYQAIEERRSIRKYKSQPIPPEKLNRVLKVIPKAPTAANKQSFKFLVIKKPKNLLKGVVRQEWALEAPIIIIAFAIEEEAWTRKEDQHNYAWVDVAIAFDHLTLAATAENLATCWIAANDPKRIVEALAVPPHWTYVALTPIGYPAEDQEAPEKKTLQEVVTHYTKQ